MTRNTVPAAPDPLAPQGSPQGGYQVHGRPSPGRSWGILARIPYVSFGGIGSVASCTSEDTLTSRPTRGYERRRFEHGI